VFFDKRPTNATYVSCNHKNMIWLCALGPEGAREDCDVTTGA